MHAQIEMERRGGLRLVRIDFIGVSGQVYGSRFEVHGRTVETFVDLASARARMAELADMEDVAA